MPLRSPGRIVPPKAAIHAAVHRMRGKRRHAHGPLAAAGGVGSPTLDLTLPHAVYDLRLDDLAAGCGLEAARETGERHLVMSGDAVVAAAEVSSGGGETAEPVQLNVGRFAQATAEAVHVLESLDAVKQGSYELRLLRIAALHLMALWLSSDEGAPDLLLALPPAPQGIQVDAPYAPADLLDRLRPLAAQRSGFKFHD